MDETEAYEAPALETVGQSLRAAREAAGKSVEDIAAATRIPTRHLTSLENSEWDKLPAPTYTMGFAKAYAGEVGIDRAAISDRLREEMGGFRPTPTVSQDYFAPTDPKRSIPIGLVAGVLIGVLLLAFGLNWLLNRDLSGPDNVPVAENVVAETPLAPAAPPPAATNMVAITATDRVWVDIRDGQTVLKQGELAQGERFVVPANALSPTIATAKPEALTINVGTAVAPALGAAGKKVTASLKAADLMRAPAPAAPPQPTSATARRPAPRAPAPSTAASVTTPAQPAAEVPAPTVNSVAQ